MPSHPRRPELTGRPARAGARCLCAIACLVVVAHPSSASARSPDPFRPAQYALEHIAAEDAWTVSRGEGVLVAVVDTGVFLDHEDLRGQVVRGEDVLDDDGDPSDEHGHGTQVAGVIAAATDNGTGISAVAPAAKVLAIRAVDARGTLSGAAIGDGIRAAVAEAAQRGMRLVVNLSLADLSASSGFTDPTNRLRADVRAAHEAGAVVVFAAGFLQPSLRDQLRDVSIWVGSSNEDDEATLDPTVSPDLLAPGAAVVTTRFDPQRPARRDLYTCRNVACEAGTASGTSIAASHVSAGAALLLSRGVDNDDVKDTLLESASKVESGGRCSRLSPCPRLRVAAREDAALPTASPTMANAPSPTVVQTPHAMSRPAVTEQPVVAARPRRVLPRPGATPVPPSAPPVVSEPNVYGRPVQPLEPPRDGFRAVIGLVALACVIAVTAWIRRGSVPLTRAGHAEVLDGVRGIAVLAVFTFHLLMVLGWPLPGMPRAAWLVVWPVAAGNLGVDLFFVLSGFLLARSWQAARAGAPLRRALGRYGSARVLRIVPAYWLSLVVLVPLVAPAMLRTAQGLGELALFASIQQFMVPLLPWKLNGVTWSLTTEVQFYILLPAVVWLLRRAGAMAGVAILLVVSLAWRTAMVAQAVDHATFTPVDWLPGRVDQFAAGVAAWMIVSGDGTSAFVRAVRSRAAGRLLVLGLAGLVLYYGSLYERVGVFRYGPAEILVHPAMGLLVAIGFVRIADRAPAYLRWAPLRFLGAISFSLYLWHLPLLETAARIGAADPRLRVGALVLMTAASVAVAVISFVFVEERAMRLRRHRGHPALPAGDQPAPVAATSRPGR